ncbi:hypothetical protein DDW09_03140 [Sulfolobus sp. SCGC AB-777_L09]|nr:hypothetical protein DDW09_03140 [Sulfolobus sp. SCGC AB-777_L09]
MIYSTSFTLAKSKREMIEIFTDPFRFSGILSHLVILQFGSKEGVFKPLSQMGEFPNYFRVMYVFGTPERGIKTVLGTLRGPIVLPNLIEYEGKDDDNTFLLQVSISVKDWGNGSRVLFSVNTNYKPKLTHKILGKEIRELKEEFNFSKHVVEEHLIPYMKLMYEIKEIRVGEDLKDE